ncbi:MAG: hypothetical protein IJ188_10910 [Clostridia bacterium]|nr:hypothetical protein [Clostridia bacterium]
MKNKRGTGQSPWKLNTLLYGLWLLLVLGTGAYASHYDAPLHQLTGRLWMALAAAGLLAPLVLKWVRNWTPRRHRLGQHLSPWAFRCICFGCSLLVLGFCFLAVNPGGFDGDPGVQLRQAVTGAYDDYYPVLHTLIAFKLPLMLTGGWFPSIMLFQILLFSLALTWVCDTVRLWANPFWAFLSLAVILLNPITQSYLMYGYKDETFGICAMTLVCMNARILFSKGDWLKKPVHLAAFALLLAATSLVRYNGILFALPCLAGAALCVNWKRALAAGGAALLLILGVRGPLSSAIGVTKTEDRSSQTMGLPMAVIGGAYTYRGEKLDEDLTTFVESVAPREVWEEKYTYGVYNWVDWDPRSNHQALADAGFGGALKYMLRAFREAPKESLNALIETTDIVYGIRPDHLADGAVYVSGADMGLRDQGIPWMKNLMYEYRRIMYILAPHCYLHSGVTLLLLVTAALGRWKLQRKESWLRIIPVLSVFAYNLVTMLMLFSWWDGARFFHYSLWVAPVLLVMLLRREEGDTAAVGP